MAGVPRSIATLLWTCAFTLGVTGTASAQYRIDAWTTENGLPQNVITEIAQTRDGFLWLATFGGLVRFDGANMHASRPRYTAELALACALRLFVPCDRNPHG